MFRLRTPEPGFLAPADRNYAPGPAPSFGLACLDVGENAALTAPATIDRFLVEVSFLGEAGEHGRAIADLDLALRVLETVSAPDASWAKWYEQIDAFLHNRRAFALAGLGKNGAATDEFEVSIRLSPENAWVCRWEESVNVGNILCSRTGTF
jgi:hypothetical protein